MTPCSLTRDFDPRASPRSGSGARRNYRCSRSYRGTAIRARRVRESVRFREAESRERPPSRDGKESRSEGGGEKPVRREPPPRARFRATLDGNAGGERRLDGNGRGPYAAVRTRAVSQPGHVPPRVIADLRSRISSLLPSSRNVSLASPS